MTAPFNNQKLFSDHFLQAVVPTLNEWNCDEEAAAGQERLRSAWNQASGLVSGHEAQTEEHWVRPVLRELGFSFQVQASVPDAQGVTRWPDYALFPNETTRTQAAGLAGTAAYFEDAVAVADAKVWELPLDKAPGAGQPASDRRNPNFQIDAYLRETKTRWGMLTNGRAWRIYSRETSYRLDSFYEVDLVDLLDAEIEKFKYFWVFFRRSAFVSQPSCFLDRVAAESEIYAQRLSGRVKGRVYEALREFINGFFAYPANALDPAADLAAAYEGSLILLYRILFSLYGEAHGLLPLDNAGYRDTYSIERIKRDLARQLDRGAPLLPSTDNYYADLANLFTIIEAGEPQLGVPPYNGGLFKPSNQPFLAANRIGDQHLAKGLDLLARDRGDQDDLAFVDYRTLEVRHLGDIYEGLLEYHPRWAEQDMVAVRHGRVESWKPTAERNPTEGVTDTAAAGTCYLATGKGERRGSGSYYTPQNIVALMVDRSVGRAISEHLSALEGADLVDGLLGLRVCDPAVGSGHFLVEAVDYIARAIVRTGDVLGAPSGESELLYAKRKVVERCIYGVDPNPLAVELAKLSLWLATVAKDRPLSFVDAHVVCGNSLIGTTVSKMGDLAGRPGAQQMNLVEEGLGRVLPDLLAKTSELVAHDSESLADVQAKEATLVQLDDLRSSFIRVANAWTARRFGVSVDEGDYLQAVTALSSVEAGGALDREPTFEAVSVAAKQFRFFHWELAFPEIFLNAERDRGFDVVLTNPPYVSAIQRRTALGEFEAPFWRNQFASASGAFDLYIPFMEQALRLTRAGGHTSLITPNKFLAAPYAEKLREYFIHNHRLLDLVDGSRANVFDDPSVYPVISFFRAADPECDVVRVDRIDEAGTVTAHGVHESAALSQLPECICAFLLLEDAELLLQLARSNAVVEGHRGMQARASTAAAEAEAFGPELREEHLAPSAGWPVVITGTIDPYAVTWGLDRLTHQRRNFLRPVLPRTSGAVSADRRAQYGSPKVIFSKLVREVEAALDLGGEYASMNTNFVLPGTMDLYALAALFNSRLINWIYEGYFGALRMAGGYLQVQAPQLRVLPIPAFPTIDAAQLDELVAELDLTQVSPSEFASNAEGDPLLSLHGLLRAFGKERYNASLSSVETKRTVVEELIEALDVIDRREQDRSWVLPRQAAILEALCDPNATDLSAYWTPLRATARTLRAEMTPGRETRLTQLAQEHRAVLTGHRKTMIVTDRQIDQAVYEAYGLSDEDISRVEAGQEARPGLTDIQED